MAVEIIRDHVFMSSIFLTGALSIFLQWLVTLSLKGYVKASSNMKTTKKKTMINLKNQFETIYETNSRVHNMDAYVDKYLLKIRFLGITYSGWEKLSFLAAGVVTILAVAGGFFGYLDNAKNDYYAEIIFSYGITLACLFIFFHIFGIKTRRQQIHIQLVDYLENSLSNRLLKGKNDKWDNIENEVDGVFDSDNEEKEQESHVVDSHYTMNEDMDMLKRLIREMDAKKAGEAAQNEVAVSSEEAVELSDAELLEEFVQSFLS